MLLDELVPAWDVRTVHATGVLAMLRIALGKLKSSATLWVNPASMRAMGQ